MRRWLALQLPTACQGFAGKWGWVLQAPGEVRTVFVLYLRFLSLSLSLSTPSSSLSVFLRAPKLVPDEGWFEQVVAYFITQCLHRKLGSLRCKEVAV